MPPRIAMTTLKLCLTAVIVLATVTAGRSTPTLAQGGVVSALCVVPGGGTPQTRG